jgi:hypothetical protein
MKPGSRLVLERREATHKGAQATLMNVEERDRGIYDAAAIYRACEQTTVFC